MAVQPASIPKSLDAYVGNGLVGYYSVSLDGTAVLWRFGRDAAVDPVERVIPTAQEWAVFRAELERVKAFDWSPEYADPSVLDGTYWGVACRWGDVAVNSSGANAFPPGFKRFCAALSDLAGGRVFA